MAPTLSCHVFEVFMNKSFDRDHTKISNRVGGKEAKCYWRGGGLKKLFWVATTKSLCLLILKMMNIHKLLKLLCIYDI